MVIDQVHPWHPLCCRGFVENDRLFYHHCRNCLLLEPKRTREVYNHLPLCSCPLTCLEIIKLEYYLRHMNFWSQSFLVIAKGIIPMFSSRGLANFLFLGTSSFVGSTFFLRLAGETSFPFSLDFLGNTFTRLMDFTLLLLLHWALYFGTGPLSPPLLLMLRLRGF